MSNAETNGRHWTDEQKELFELDNAGRPRFYQVAVLADAGSGKTSVLVERVRRILAANPDHRVLCISFTEKSAADLSHRLSQYLSADVFTIHGFCSRVIKEHGFRLDLPPTWRILDARESSELLIKSFHTVYRRQPPSNGDLSSAQWLSLVQDMAALRYKILGAITYHGQSAKEFVSAVITHYDERKSKLKVLEYGDLESMAVALLKQSAVKSLYQRRYQHIFVDEFQDTSQLQCDLVRALVGPSQSLFVVGDSKQSIYRFRGADVQVFEKFVGDLPHKKYLSQNFRSHRHVIDGVNATSQRMIPHFKPMTAGRKESEQSVYHSLSGTNSLNQRVQRWVIRPGEDARAIMAVLQLLEEKKIPSEDVVLLLPRLKGAAPQAMLAALQQAGWGVVIGGSAGIKGQPSFQALLRLWIAVMEPWQSHRLAEACVFLGMSRNEILKHWVQISTVSPVAHRHAAATDLLSACEFLESLNRAFSLKEKLGVYFLQFKVLIALWQEQGLSAAEIARRFSQSLETEQDIPGLCLPPPPPHLSGAIKVFTVHGSKGLEYPVVVLADLNGRKYNKQKPYVVYGNDVVLGTRDDQGEIVRCELSEMLMAQDMAEDCLESGRLLYVAMTRAEEALFVLDTQKEEKESEKKKPSKNSSKKSTEPEVVAGLGNDQENGLAKNWAEALRLGVPHAIENAEWLPLGQKSVQPERDPAPQPATATAPAISEPVVYVPSRVGATAILKKSTKKYTELSSASGAELVSFGLGEPLISSKVDAATLGKQIHRALECDDATQLDSVLQRDGFQLSAFYDWLKTSEGRICFPKMSSQICLSHAPGAGSPVDPALRRRAEFAFDLKIQSGSVMTGRVDLMIEWPKEKKLWIVDHKIHFRRRTKEHLFQEHKEQLMLYADAIKKLVPNYQLQTYVVDVTASTGSVWHCFSSESC